MLDVTPLNKRVIAKVLKSEATEETTAAGLLLQKEAGKKLDYLEVIAVDPQITEIKVGDKIYVSRYSGDTYKEEGEEYYYVEYKDVIGKKNNG